MYKSPREPNIIFRSYRHIVTGGFRVACPRCGRKWDNWTAFEMPYGSQEMYEAMERLRPAGSYANNVFYSFWKNEYRVSFPSCGHQEVVPAGAVLRFYGFY